MRKMYLLSIIPCYLLLATGGLFADVPHLISYQGKLTDTSNVAINGNHDLTFVIFDSAIAGDSIWWETHNGVEIQRGLFSVTLGETNPLNILFDEQYWLETRLDGVPLLPRVQLTSSAYSLRAAVADSAVPDNDWIISGSNMYSGVSGNVGIGTISPNTKLEVAGDIHLSGADRTIFNRSNNYLAFGTNNTERIRITNTGNVSIGTSSPAEKLIVKMGGTTWANPHFALEASGSTDKWDFTVGSANRLYAGYNETSLLVVDTLGNVGIGTPSQAAKLDVTGHTLTELSSGDPGYWIYKGDAGVANLYWGILSTGVGSYNHLSIGKNSSMSITGFSEKVTIFDNGYVGIGTANARSPLTIKQIETPTIRDGGIRITTDAPSNPYRISIYVDSTNAYAGIQSEHEYAAWPPLSLNPSGGNVGIGTTSPGYRLHVETSGGRAGYFKNTSTSVDYYGVYGECRNTPGYGYGGYFAGGWVGVRGEASLDGGGYRYGIYGYALGGEDGNYGVYGYASNNTGTKFGVFSSAVGAGTNYGVYGHVSGGTTNWAGYFSGNVNVTGSLSKGSGSFLIDHPLDPFNKTLRHNFVESPENLCLYRGKAKLDENGKAIIYMPDYFIALTKENEATIQLTPIAHRSIVTYEWNENFTAFVILGDANREVSYTVYADRDDPVMHQLYRPVEEEKGNGNFTKGKLLYPKAHGYPEEMGEDYQHRAENEKKSAN